MPEKIVYAWPKEKNADKNPYNKILYSTIEEQYSVIEFNKNKFKPKKGSILHVHWPDHMLRLKSSLKIRLRLWRFFFLVNRLHRSGGKLIWTVHNLSPHQKYHPKLASRGLESIAKVADGFICLSEFSKQKLLSQYSFIDKSSVTVVPHLHYSDHYTAVDKNNALDALVKNPKPVQLLCFGVIRDHKGYGRLFEVVKKLKSCQNVGWIIAGNPGKDGISDNLKKLWSEISIVYKACRYINDKEIPSLFAAADAVVLPYDAILNSGTAILALSFERPIIAPAIGSLIELKEKIGEEWVYLYEQPLDEAKLSSALEWVRHRKPLQGPELEEMSPSLVAHKTCDFYEKILSTADTK